MAMYRYNQCSPPGSTSQRCPHYDHAAFLIKGDMVCQGCIGARIYALEEENKELKRQINYMITMMGGSFDEGA